MNMTDRSGWELQWQPPGGRVRRLAFSWRGMRNLLLALGFLVLLAVGAGLLAGRDGLRARGAIGSARFENSILRERQEALRQRASSLFDRPETVGRESAPFLAASRRGLALVDVATSSRLAPARAAL